MKRSILTLLGVLFLTPAYGADSTVSSMTGASTLDGTELYYCVQGGADRKCTGSQIKTLANTSAVRATTTTSEALANSDQGKLVTFSNGSAVAATIAQAGSGGNFASGWAVSLKNLGAGTVTLTPTTSTVDGAATVTLTTGQGLDLYSDGTNYFTQAGKVGGGSSTITAGSTATSGITSGNFISSSSNLAADSGKAVPSGAVVGTTDTQTLTNKSIAASQINSGTLPTAQMPALTGDCTTSAGAVATTCKATPNVPATGLTSVTTVYNVNAGLAGTNTNAITTNRLYQVPVWVKPGTAVTTLAVVMTVAGTGNCNIGIYNMSSGGQPTTLVQDAGSLAATGTGVITATVSQTLNNGWYFLALVCPSGPTLATVNGASSGSPLGASLIASGANPTYGLFRAFTSGALPADESAQTYTVTAGSVIPVIGVK